MRRKPGTDTKFQAHFAGNWLSVTGFARGICCPFVVPPKRLSTPEPDPRNRICDIIISLRGAYDETQYLLGVQRPMRGGVQILRTVPWWQNCGHVYFRRYAGRRTSTAGMAEQDHACRSQSGRRPANGLRFPAGSLQRVAWLLRQHRRRAAGGGRARLSSPITERESAHADRADVLGRALRNAGGSIRNSVDGELPGQCEIMSKVRV